MSRDDGPPPAFLSDIRRSIKALMEEAAAALSPMFGYAMRGIEFGEAIEITLEKGASSFVVWLRPASDASASYKDTASLKLGYQGAPPDRQAYHLLDALHERLARWERSQSPAAYPRMFDPAPAAPVAAAAEPVDATVHSLLSQANITPLYQDWLVEREQRFTAQFQCMSVRACNVLLVNATMGLQYYPSIADYFALLHEVHPEIRVTGVSYFEHIYQFQDGVARKGLPVLPTAEVSGWGVEEFNRFDVVLLVGPSDVMAHLMAMERLTARLVLLDLAFYHQLIDQHSRKFFKNETLTVDKSIQVNKVVVYSCQPASKARKDIGVLCSLALLEWNWFNYIPIGFSYARYYQSDRHLFDVALLGSSGRDYSQIDPALFRGVRFLFLGSLESAPIIQRLREELDITVVPKVDPDVYARLVALCRCVVIPPIRSTPPYFPGVTNVLVSLVDSLAMGKALVTARHEGLNRLERDGLPAVFYDSARPEELFRQVDALLHEEGRLTRLSALSMAFAQKQLDIYCILGTILREHIL